MTIPKTVLIVDDEPDICQLLSMTLEKMNLKTLSTGSFVEAKTLLTKKTIDFCLTDMRLPDGDGLALLDFINQQKSPIPVVVITAHGNMETAITAMKLGAFDFINKPIDIKLLRNLVEDALNINYHPKKTKAKDFNLIGDSPCMAQLRTQIEKIASSQAPVYISGPSGVGKELVARLIHQNSPRRDKPFIPVNCGAIPVELMESEFFGHKKGSFTGAHQDKIGFFQAAHQGTLFLDEVGDLPLNMQVKLLRGIQEKAFRPIGDTQEHSANIRFLCATHQDLQALVKQGGFREDLFYRLNVIQIAVPTLKERIQDLPLLVDYILHKISHHQQEIALVSNDAMTALQTYSFPGNIRELENILERALTLSNGQTIESHDLQLPSQTEENISSHALNTSLDAHLESVEKQAIINALKAAKGNKTEAAKLLGLTFRTLRYRLKKLEIEEDDQS